MLATDDTGVFCTACVGLCEPCDGLVLLLCGAVGKVVVLCVLYYWSSVVPPVLAVCTGAGPLQQLIELGGPGAVVNSLDGVSSSNGSNVPGVTIPRLEGDFSLNAANVLSADLLLRSGLSRLCPTHDLNVSRSAAGYHAVGRSIAPARHNCDGLTVHTLIRRASCFVMCKQLQV